MKQVKRKIKDLKGISNAKIALDTELHRSEISMALAGNRLLGREKLKKIFLAGYAIEPFIFGLHFWNEVRGAKND